MQFLSTVCMAAIASALFRMLIPENKYAKQISLLMAGLFILAGVNAVRGADIVFDAGQYNCEDSADYIGFSGDINRELQKKICTEMSDKVYSLLNEHGICPEEVHIAVNISGLYSISITQVELVFSGGQRSAAEAAEKLLARELPEEIRVTSVIKE